MTLIEKGTGQCVSKCHPRREFETNPYSERDYKLDQDPDSSIDALACENDNEAIPLQATENTVPAKIASDDSTPQVANAGNLGNPEESNSGSDNEKIDPASAEDSSTISTPENPANAGKPNANSPTDNEDTLTSSNDENPSDDPTNNGYDGASTWINAIGPAQAATKRARGFRPRAGIRAGTWG